MIINKGIYFVTNHCDKNILFLSVIPSIFLVFAFPLLFMEITMYKAKAASTPDILQIKLQTETQMDTKLRNKVFGFKTFLHIFGAWI